MPLDGIKSPFGPLSPFGPETATYAVAGFEPALVFDFANEVYRTGGNASNFSDSITFARSGDATMVDATGTIVTVGTNEPRIGHHVHDGSGWVNAGLLIESEARTQLLHTTDALVTQSHTVTAVPHTLHFTGTGTVTLSGASTDGPLVGTGAGEENRVSLTFTPSAGSLTLTVSGTVTNAQLEVGSTPSSYIPNLAGSGTVTRAAETLTVPAANLPYDSANMSIQTQGRMTYNQPATLTAFPIIVRWLLDADNRINHYLVAGPSNSGYAVVLQEEGGVNDAESSPDLFSPGVFVPYNIAGRHGPTFVNAAVDGTAYTTNTTPTALPDLSATDLDLAFDYMGAIKLFRMWDDDLGDAGIEEASA